MCFTHVNTHTLVHVHLLHISLPFSFSFETFISYTRKYNNNKERLQTVAITAAAPSIVSFVLSAFWWQTPFFAHHNSSSIWHRCNYTEVYAHFFRIKIKSSSGVISIYSCVHLYSLNQSTSYLLHNNETGLADHEKYQINDKLHMSIMYSWRFAAAIKIYYTLIDT